MLKAKIEKGNAKIMQFFMDENSLANCLTKILQAILLDNYSDELAILNEEEKRDFLIDKYKNVIQMMRAKEVDMSYIDSSETSAYPFPCEVCEVIPNCWRCPHTNWEEEFILANFQI